MRVTERLDHEPLFVVLDVTDKGPVVSAQFKTQGEAHIYANVSAENHEREFIVLKAINSVSHQRVHTIKRKFFLDEED